MAWITEYWIYNFNPLPPSPPTKYIQRMNIKITFLLGGLETTPPPGGKKVGFLSFGSRASNFSMEGSRPRPLPHSLGHFPQKGGLNLRIKSLQANEIIFAWGPRGPRPPMRRPLFYWFFWIPRTTGSPRFWVNDRVTGILGQRRNVWVAFVKIWVRLEGWIRSSEDINFDPATAAGEDLNLTDFNELFVYSSMETKRKFTKRTGFP